MFGLGFFEIIIVVVTILIFVKPKDLPDFVHKCGRAYGQLSRAYEIFFRKLNEERQKVEIEFESSSHSIKNINKYVNKNKNIFETGRVSSSHSKKKKTEQSSKTKMKSSAKKSSNKVKKNLISRARNKK